tara:strand:- start:577 stop:720 length:144 start_codon:yes stop_codon:yes gene_type:complete
MDKSSGLKQFDKVMSPTDYLGLTDLINIECDDEKCKCKHLNIKDKSD